MNRSPLIFLLSLFSIAIIYSSEKVCDSCVCKATSKTFLSIRPAYQLGSPERLTFFRSRMDTDQEGHHGTLQVVALGGRSTKPDRIASYFMPDCKTQLRVTEQQQANTDILANQLNIYTANGTYESIITMCPRHRFAGIGFTYKQALWDWSDCNTLWFRISFPILNVKNSVNFSERTINNGGGVDPDEQGVVGSATQAFQQSNWRYGRIENCKRSITRLGDVEVSLGYEFVERPECRLESFVGLLLPSSNRPKGVRLFEPIIGYNKHMAIFFGSSLVFEFWRNCTDEHALSMAFDMNGQYFLRRTQIRSLDLKLKPWSRYMQVYCDQVQAQQAADLNSRSLSTPGINIFTQKLQVNPGFARVINTAFIYDWCDRVEIEAGYNLFAREAECVKLDCPFKQGVALKALRGMGYTNDVQQIGNVFSDDILIAPNDVAVANYMDNIISPSDLDLESASHPCVLEHILYLAAAHKWEDRCHPILAGGGGSYQFAASNIGLNQWMLWAKVVLSF
jgi:hypothetical protein